MSIVELIQKIVQHEMKKIHIIELGIITSVFPHSSELDKDNYECNIKLKDKEIELRKVPVATSHIGLSNILHTGDLVLVSYISGDFNSPVIIGRLYNDEDRPPLSKEEEIVYQPPYTQNNSLRRLNIMLPQGVTNINLHDDRMSIVIGRSSMYVDSNGEILVNSIKNQESVDGGTEIITNDKSHRISVTSTNGVASIDMNDSGYIKLESNPADKICEIIMSDAGIQISTDLDISVDAYGDMSIDCQGDLLLRARNITLESEETIKIKSGLDLETEAKGSITTKSNTMTDLESGGPITIKGALVRINP